MSENSAFPESVADYLSLEYLEQEDINFNLENLRALYRYARGEDGTRVLFKDNSSFAKGWIDASSASAQKMLEPFLVYDEDTNPRKARQIVQANLEACSWNNDLGIQEPAIQIKVKIHGNHWGFRFQSSLGRKGLEVINEELPPLPESLPSQNRLPSEVSEQSPGTPFSEFLP